MGKLRINKRSVDELKPAVERLIFWNDKLPAFGCEVMPSGIKSYKLMYRVGGRLRKLTLGRHGLITAAEAREPARRAQLRPALIQPVTNSKPGALKAFLSHLLNGLIVTKTSSERLQRASNTDACSKGTLNRTLALAR